MTLIMEREEALIDPTPGDWYNRALAHLERGDRAKALLCFEQILVQQPADHEVHERVRDLQAGIDGSARERYDALQHRIAAEQARLGVAAQVAIFNQPTLLGLEAAQRGDEKR